MQKARGRISPRREGESCGGAPCVLVVENDPDSQTLMRTILGAHYRVRIAGSDEELQRELEAGPIALVLMDFSLRGSAQDGLALGRTLRADSRLARMPIVALTAHASVEDRTQALGAGCDAFLAKPVSTTDLVATIAPAARAPASSDEVSNLKLDSFDAVFQQSAAQTWRHQHLRPWP